MASLLLEKFGGMLPGWHDQLLPDGQASRAVNTYLYNGALAGWRKPKLLRTLTNSAAKCAFRIPDNEETDTTLSGASHWLEFTDIDTDVLRSPVVQDTFDRYYWCSPTLTNVNGHRGPQYNTHDRIIAGSDPWLLGLNAPGCAPGIAVTGGGNLALLGNDGNDGGSSVANMLANTVYLQKITLTGDMQLSDVSFLPEETSDTVRYAAVLYSDVAGAPSTLLAAGQIITGTTAGTTAVSAFINPYGVSQDTTYWFGIMIEADLSVHTGGRASDTHIVAEGKSFAQTFTNGPATDAGSTSGSPAFNMWADLTTSDVIESRAYVYTWISEYGEESPPSPFTLADGFSNAKWTITLWTPPSTDLGGVGADRNIVTVRIYRTVADQGGNAEYFFVADVAVGTATYEDVEKDDVIALNDTLPSTNWFPPPDDLKGIQMMPNGIMVGFRKNELWFSEAYRPHAWPPDYVQTVEFPIVGIGVSSQSVVACTSGAPYVASGVDPSSISLNKINISEPCASRGSIVSQDNGVFYISPNGLIAITPSNLGGNNSTEGWITRERWNELAPIYNTRAQRVLSTYMCFSTAAQTGFTVELANDSTSFSFWPQPGGHRLGFQQMTHPDSVQIDNLLIDRWTGVPLIVRNGQVYYYDFTDQSPTIQPFIWRSKVYQQQVSRNFGAIQLNFDIPNTTPAQVTRNTAAFNDASWDTLGANQYGIIRIIVDDVVQMQREIRTNREVLRIPSGFKGLHWAFEIEARVSFTDIQIASTPKDLKNV